ncbi:polysaccharide deacetylase family protein [Candidatus Nitrosocosmicus sp. T]
MGIILISLHGIIISLTIFAITIVINDASGFSLPEEMDYSVPFNFGSFSDLTMDYSNLDEVTNSTKELNDLNLSENGRTDMTVETQPDHIQNNEHLDQKTNEMVETSSRLLNSTSPHFSEKTDDSVNRQMKLDSIKTEPGELSLNPNLNDNKIAIINFDDNWKSQYQYAKPILDKFEFKATFYVVCDYMDKKNRISWNELQNLYTEGHEIGSHSMSHANLDNIMTGVAHNEIIQSKKCIEDRGIKVNSFSYPFNSGDDNSEILDLVSSNYEFARTAGGDPGNKIRYENDESVKRYTIVGWSHDAEKKEHFYSDSEMLQKFKEYVAEYSKRDGKNSHLPIIIYHKIGDIKDTQSTSLDLFESEMNYLHEKGFKVVTMDQVFGKS